MEILWMPHRTSQGQCFGVTLPGIRLLRWQLWAESAVQNEPGHQQKSRRKWDTKMGYGGFYKWSFLKMDGLSWKVEKMDDEQGYPHDYGNLYIDGRCHGIKCINGISSKLRLRKIPRLLAFLETLSWLEHVLCLEPTDLLNTPPILMDQNCQLKVWYGIITYTYPIF